MASNNTTRARPMIVMLVLITLLSPVPDQDCPRIIVLALIDACRHPPGLAACVAQCRSHHYHGGYCDMLPNGRPGDCCINCLSAGHRRVG
uniref:Knottin scorpion toxin-like domain-containing protein n=1 Tax=Setaria viridis TaxID=4556 RepID=A0A4U6W5R8_SETVI|nr:hypothetical protein SEVIR_1G070000v2 [Setaria viridis]